MTWYRHADARYPFLWEDAAQPAARWHGTGEGPANYFADTPDGAWAEFLRHEEITALEDLAGVSRAIWAVEVRDQRTAIHAVGDDDVLGGESTYPACQQEARDLRQLGYQSLIAPSAVLAPGEAAGWGVQNGQFRMPARDGQVLVLFGPPGNNIQGWMTAVDARPPVRLLMEVRHFGAEGR